MSIKWISSDFLVLPIPLGKHISPLHHDFRWTTNTDRSSLHLRIISDEIIWWYGMDIATSSFPKMYKIFVSKQVLGWCGTNSKVSLWDSSIPNTCPNCGIAKE
jgi:hypothetical protein